MLSPERPVVHVTFDGILQPIGYAQVARITLGLARRGVPYRILSLERPQELEDRELVSSVRERLEGAGIAWTALPYDTAGTAPAAASNVGRLTAALLGLAARRRVSLVHARAYQAGLVALAARRGTGMPYLLDARCYWIDERLVDGRWFGRPTVHGAARAIERRLFRDASGVVTLTALQAGDLREGRFGPWTGAPIEVIPTCADYDEFRPRGQVSLDRVPAPLRQRLEGRRVIALVGSINASYHVKESIEVARQALALAPDTHLLVLGAQEALWQEKLDQAGIEPTRRTIAYAAHEDMPAFTSLMDCCVLLLAENAAKRASVPTKLAELFASGVRPVQFGCNTEVSRWVREAGSGMVLSSLEPGELERAARFIAEGPRDHAALERAREVTYPHFSLKTGLDRYERLLRTLLDGPKR